MTMKYGFFERAFFQENRIHRQAFSIPLKRFPETQALGGIKVFPLKASRL
jgi:hypothetical protein